MENYTAPPNYKNIFIFLYIITTHCTINLAYFDGKLKL